MLLSMTGYGEGQAQNDGTTAWVEIRTVNNRHLKVSTRITDGYASMESQIEKFVRTQIRRGSVQIQLQIHRLHSGDDYQINDQVLRAYLQQLEDIAEELDIGREVSWSALLTLPGVVEEVAIQHADVQVIWPVVEQAVSTALDQLQAMRSDEGAAMARDLLANCDAMRSEAEEIASRLPTIVEGYQERLKDRLNQLLAPHNLQIEPSDIIREVGIFSERVDVSEELVRLRSHLEQFHAIVQGDEPGGRKLEFLTQEMLRETNTIGSKASDAEVSQRVVYLKTIIERLREMIQNVE